VDKRLEEEYERTVHCLSMTTEVKIRTIVETQLIANNLKTLMEVSISVCHFLYGYFVLIGCFIR
jgi:cullin 3